MVENVNKIPDILDFEDPEVIKQLEKADKKTPVKGSQKNGAEKSNDKGKSPAKPKSANARQARPGGRPAPAKLVLTNQNKKKRDDFTQFKRPGTFESKYGDY